MKSMRFTGLLPILALAASILVSACKKEPALLPPTSFEVPELVHVYGGHPFTRPIVTEPASADISGLEFTHPEKTNYEVKIKGNQAILTYVPLAENDATEGLKVRSETLSIGNEALGYKDVVVHVSSSPISVAFLAPFNAAEISDGAVLKVEGKEQTDAHITSESLLQLVLPILQGRSLILRKTSSPVMSRPLPAKSFPRSRSIPETHLA